MNSRILSLAGACCLGAIWAWSPVATADAVIVTGKHWVDSSYQLKKAYLLGVANVLDVEEAYYGDNPASDTQSYIPRTVRGLAAGGYTVDTVLTGLDEWYAANPANLDRPVLETIWAEMVIPNLAKSQ